MAEPTSDRVYLITGCSSGFGRALADAVLERGGRVVATARRVETVRDLVEAHGDAVLPLALDVTRPDTIAGAVEEALGRFGRIDVLVNNAGYGMVGAIEEVGDEDVRRVFDTNVFGLLATTRAVLPIMRRQRSGHVLMISSVGGLVSNPGSAIYCSTKFAVEAVGEALASEVAPFGIRVTIVEPGAFRTDFAGRSYAQAPAIEAYADGPAGAWRRRMGGIDGRQPGDPAKAAAAMIAAVEAADPPLRLVLGNAALERVREKLAGVADELTRWEATSRGADFEQPTSR